MKYEKKWGYMLCKTKFPGVYRNQKGGFVVRARVLDPAKRQREILKAGDWASETEALVWLDQEKEQIKAGSVMPVAKLFSVYAADLLDRKLTRGEIKSAAGERKWRTRLVHLIQGVSKGGLSVDGLGDLPVTELRPATIEMLKDQAARMVQAGIYHPVTVNGWLSVLRTISRQISLEYETRDFMSGVNDLDTSLCQTYTEEEPNALPPSKVPEFLALMKERWPQHYAFILLGFVTGLRPSTIRPLRRTGPEADVLWDQARILVRRSETYGKVMAMTKTGIRYSVHLPPDVVEILKWHVETQLTREQLRSELLFPSEVGGFRAGSCLKKPFRDVSDAMQLGYPLTPRGMRRTFQDLARAAQVQDLVTRSVSGHTTDSMQRLYSTVAPAEQRESLTRVFRVIQGGASSEVVGLVVGESSRVVGN